VRTRRAGLRGPSRGGALRAPVAAWLSAALAAACGGRAPSAVAAPQIAPPAASLAHAESVYADLRDVRDRIAVTTAAGRTTSPEGLPLATMVRRSNELRGTLLAQLAAVDSTPLAADDRRALATMRRSLDGGLGELSEEGVVVEGSRGPPDCAYDARVIGAAPNGLDSLTQRTYACYGWAQHHVTVDGRQVDRLTVLGELARTDDPKRRRRLFLALDPVWRTINGDGGPSSPYRRLVALAARDRARGEGRAAEPARDLGVPPDTMEQWLVAILDGWRASTPDSLVEPWDWYYAAGRASRVLGPRIPPERLTKLNAEVFRALGADVDSLHVRYDLAPREGKTPVAFTDFGRRARWRNGAWRRGEPWVFATYRAGGLDNLNELLHETGHAVHIAAIRTRPAFADWPDSDPFTEGLADFVAVDVFEPAWQQRWLGDSVPLADGLRARYAGVVMDVAWALFEVRMQRDPTADPNVVWTDLTRRYLKVRPYPELSWWAMRGQLVDSPGYMMNYAVGAILIAAIRDRTRELHGPFAAGDSTWYGWVAPRLFRFGLERPSRVVIEQFLGGPITPRAILADIGRMRR
jgi:hypothetical protein